MTVLDLYSWNLPEFLNQSHISLCNCYRTVPPRTAHVTELAQFHGREYLQYLSTVSEDPENCDSDQEQAEQFGLCTLKLLLLLFFIIVVG